MASAQVDPDAFRAQQRAIWDITSSGWEAWREVYEDGAAVVTARLLELGGVHEGHKVLDVATGHGEPALEAAELVGPKGRVVGLDISQGMLETARKRAAGLDNVEFVEGDMESIDYPPGSFDVVLSRFALMLAIDHIGAFRGMARVLVSGGVLAAAVWGPHDTHLLAAGPTALGERLRMPKPPPGFPTTFSMSDSRELADELTGAGFVDVSVTEQVVPYRFPSVAEYVRYNREILPRPMMQMVRDHFGSEDDPEAWEVVARAAEKYVDDDGTVSLPSIALCLRAVAPGETSG